MDLTVLHEIYATDDDKPLPARDDFLARYGANPEELTKQKGLFKNLVIAAMAGSAAAVRVDQPSSAFGLQFLGAAFDELETQVSDYSLVNRAIQCIAFRPGENKDLFEECLTEACKLVHQPKVWSFIRAAATKLSEVGTMSADESLRWLNPAPICRP